jgi:hypothetical protein
MLKDNNVYVTTYDEYVKCVKSGKMPKRHDELLDK